MADQNPLERFDHVDGSIQGHSSGSDYDDSRFILSGARTEGGAPTFWEHVPKSDETIDIPDGSD